MNLKQTDSGLFLLEGDPKLPTRSYDPLEIQEPEQRQVVCEVLNNLWDAMQLTRRPQLVDIPRRESHLLFYRTLAKMLLGKDYPEKDQET